MPRDYHYVLSVLLLAGSSKAGSEARAQQRPQVCGPGDWHCQEGAADHGLCQEAESDTWSCHASLACGCLWRGWLRCAVHLHKSVYPALRLPESSVDGSGCLDAAVHVPKSAASGSEAVRKQQLSTSTTIRPSQMPGGTASLACSCLWRGRHALLKH